MSAEPTPPVAVPIASVSQCIWDEKQNCRSGWDCPGIGNSATCTYYSNETCSCVCLCYGMPPCPNPVCQSNGSWICDSPILVDTAGEGFHLTRAADGVYFDLWANGSIRKFSWTDPQFHNGWLALDRNGNGVIDDGSELFGSATPQPSPPAGRSRNGFNALAVYDDPANGGNGNGLIDPGDAIYDKLLVWIDANHSTDNRSGSTSFATCSTTAQGSGTRPADWADGGLGTCSWCRLSNPRCAMRRSALFGTPCGIAIQAPLAASRAHPAAPGGRSVQPGRRQRRLRSCGLGWRLPNRNSLASPRE